MKILVVDDHVLVREGLSLVLQALEPGQAAEVLQAGDCQQGFALANAHPDLDLVLLDYHLPGMNGLAALDVFGDQYPDIPVVILSGSANPGTMQRALAKGAAGFITKSGQSAELLDGLRRVLAGEIYASAGLGWSTDATTAISTPVFTPRQEQVLQLLLDGLSNRDIGLRLHLSDETVKNHITSILRILGVKTRMQAALEAARWGYTKSSSSPG